MIGSLRAAGADVLAFTLPDPVPINPIAKSAAARLRNLNVAVRDLAAKHGAKLVDLEAHPVASDRRLWDLDRLHANPLGHARIADAAAEALGLEGADASWTTAVPRPARPAHPRLPRRLGRQVLHALGDPAHPRRLLRRRHHGEAPDARAGPNLRVSP